MRPDCFPCSTAGEDCPKGACIHKNIIHETYCITCEKDRVEPEKNRGEEKKKVKKVDYKPIHIGETYRSKYERGKNIEKIYTTKEKQHMLHHILD